LRRRCGAVLRVKVVVAVAMVLLAAVVVCSRE
jgi:hypothetical protein